MSDKDKILIVDDERMNITILADLLRDHYNIAVAKNGEQALKRIFSDTPPDLILLDIVMPNMSGYEVCSKIKADPRSENIPVIFITSMSEEDDETKGFELGAADYISKPFRSAVVRARIKNYLLLKQRGDILERLSTLDGLTGISNRRRFDGYLADEWFTMRRVNKPMSVILMDIDFFKPFNDNYGHPAGDECLKIVAAALAETTARSTDLVARYGGEEFAVVLPDTPLEGAVHIAEKMRQSIAELNIPHAHSAAGAYVSISLGVAATMGKDGEPMVNPGSGDGSSDELLRTADQFLYQAKERGRNQVAFPSTPILQPTHTVGNEYSAALA